MEERIAQLDKDFESMQIVQKKNIEESVFEPDKKKPRKKITMDQDDNIVNKPLTMTSFDIKNNCSGQRLQGRDKGGHSRSVKKDDAPPSFDGVNQFPDLGESTGKPWSSFQTLFF